MMSDDSHCRRHGRLDDCEKDTTLCFQSMNLRSGGSTDRPHDVRQVHKELQFISDRLKSELRVISARESAVKEKELLLNEAHASLDRLISVELQKKMAEKDQLISQLKEDLREKFKESKRMKDNFDTLKLANDTLHKELESSRAALEKLEKQHASLQGRIANLQRKNSFTSRRGADGIQAEFLTKQSDPVSLHEQSSALRPASTPSCGRSRSKVKVRNAAINDIVIDLLDWVSETSLRQSLLPETNERLAAGLESSLYVQEKCIKVLPQLLEIVRELSSRDVTAVLTCLQFTYWATVQLDFSLHEQQKVALPSTLRRLGEELYTSRPPAAADCAGDEAFGTDQSPVNGNFLHSSDYRIRFLSALIILKTISQVDRLAYVFEVVRNDLKLNDVRQLFLHCNALPVFLSYIRPTNKLLMNAAIDVMLLMCSESSASTLCSFVEACSVPTVASDCLQKLALIWRAPTAETQILEKVSILLQKLSKVRSNRKYFDLYGIATTCNEYLRTRLSDSEFLTINIKSIVYNLNVGGKGRVEQKV